MRAAWLSAGAEPGRRAAGDRRRRGPGAAANPVAL